MEKWKIYNASKQRKELEKLTGEDFIKAEEMARLEGEKGFDIATSRTFYACIASRAYKIPVEDIKAVPIREYMRITGDVGNFLITPVSAKESELPKTSEKSV